MTMMTTMKIMMRKRQVVLQLRMKYLMVVRWRSATMKETTKTKKKKKKKE